MPGSQQSQLENIANILKETVDKTLRRSSGFTYTKDPEAAVKEIIEYESRMRVVGMEKFNGPCFGSYINYYRSLADKDAHKAAGALLIYAERDVSDKLLKGLGYPVKLLDEDEVLLENTGELCKDLSKSFLENVSSLGYGNLVTSDPVTFLNDAPEGVEFDYKEYQLSQANFYLWKQKAFCAEVTLSR